MLVADLRRLFKEGRLRLEGSLSPDDEVWAPEDPRPAGPLEVAFGVQRTGMDVLVQGTISGELELPCRRCLEQVRIELEEPLALLFREGAVPGEEDGSYPLPERASELDLRPAVREHWLLAAPQFVVCSEACRGICPHCGQNRNQVQCDCSVEEADERWAPLLRLKKE